MDMGLFGTMLDMGMSVWEALWAMAKLLTIGGVYLLVGNILRDIL